MSLLIISTSFVYAQESPITVQTDDNNYDEGDTIVVSGKVNTKIAGVDVVLQLFREGNMLEIAQIKVAQDGTFSHTILAEGPLWTNSGTILVRASYEVAGGTIAETEFSYTPKSEVVTTTTNFEVDAGSHGTFDVEYSIKGGEVEDMVVESENFALAISINSTDEGSITLELPREFIGAEKQDGKDEKFIILISSPDNPNGIEADYEEAPVHSDHRTITINFEQGDTDILIIGTYVVPEFGTIAMIVLLVGIMTAIILTRNKFQIKI
nr:PEFG-CTERM sorting domain-containing protein [Nitrosopumilus maritimus]